MTQKPTAPNLEIDLAAVDQIIDRIGGRRHNVTEILQAIQREFRYLPEAALRRVCLQTEITPAQLMGVATFYTEFRLRPVGKHIIRVCHGTACYVRGAVQITEAVRRLLHVPEDDDTDPNRMFTVQEVACLGCCSLAPCLMIGDVTYGHLTPRSVGEAIENFLEHHAR